MGPPDAAAPALWVVTKGCEVGLGDCGVGTEVTAELLALLPDCGVRGRVSKERARRQEARTIEKELAMRGSWVEV